MRQVRLFTYFLLYAPLRHKAWHSRECVVCMCVVCSVLSRCVFSSLCILENIGRAKHLLTRTPGATLCSQDVVAGRPSCCLWQSARGHGCCPENRRQSDWPRRQAQEGGCDRGLRAARQLGRASIYGIGPAQSRTLVPEFRVDWGHQVASGVHHAGHACAEKMQQCWATINAKQ